jgi:hypothetical protein
MTMPQSASQRNRQAVERQKPAPEHLAKLTTDTEDDVYGLVSVLYHALQGVQACEQYVDDAERAGDDELVRFFEECRDQQNERANRAKQLLMARADEDDDSDDEESEDDEEDGEGDEA